MNAIYKNLEDKLRQCDDVSKVDSILDGMGISPKKEERINFIEKFIGVTNTFSDGVANVDEDYAVAKEELVFHNSIFSK